MKAKFDQIQPVRLFRERLTRELDARISPYDFWASGMAWLRDAWCARTFAELTSAKVVGLVTDQRPDFEVGYRNGLHLRFEVTCADLPGRKIALEEKRDWDAGITTRLDPGKNWKVRRQAIPAALEAASVRKKRKALKGLYPPKTNLLIYLNLGTYDNWRDEIEVELVEHTSVVRPYFNSIWVLWSGRLHRVWPEPFIGATDAFRPKRHALGKALNFYREKREIADIFNKRIEG